MQVVTLVENLILLFAHPDAEIVTATSRKFDGEPIYKVHPHLKYSEIQFENLKPDEINADLVFTATPHGASMKIVPELLENNMKVVDLSGDYRFDNLKTYEKWYGYKHSHHIKAVYGLPEINRKLIKKADFVANPGCYPTGAILACLPIVAEKIAEKIVVDSKSGVSGAGVTPQMQLTFPIVVIVSHPTQLQHTVTVLKYRRNYQSSETPRYPSPPIWYR